MKALLRFRKLSGTALLIFLAGSAYACKDFLETPPQGSLDGLTLANATGVEGSLIATYRILDRVGATGIWGAAASNWTFGSATSDDAYKGSEASDQPPITDLEYYNWGTAGADSYLNDKWSHSYEGVVRANATINLLDDVVAADPDEISQADQNGIRGEATFLRAHFHFEAWRMWENIPYYTEADTSFRKSNQGVDALGNIIADLNTAIGLLPASPRKGEVGRATSWTARAYLGKVQMYAEQFGDAITTLEGVTGAGSPFALETSFDQVWTGFVDLNNGPETILAYQASANDGNPSGDNSNWGERLNFPHSGSPFGCCGFHQPSQNLINFFQVDAQGLPLALTDATWNDFDGEWDAATSAGVAFDPRLDWTVGRDEVPYKDWGNHEASWIRAPAFGGLYSPKKTAYEDASGAVSNVGWVPTQTSSMNIHIYRYADALLLLAEAYVEEGRLEDARAIVNQIRARAAQTAQGPNGGPIAVPIDDAGITWADYQIGQYTAAWTDQAAAMTRVRYERRLELAMEGERFFDLRRWRTAPQVLNTYLAAEVRRLPHLAAAATFADRHSLYPLPTLQIELSKENGEQTLVQNPGW